MNRYPLYIGKSINIRARLLSHLRTPKEARLLKQTSHISYIPTAGEISALLLEAQMIKQQQPLYNRRLRKTKDTCSFVLNETGVRILYTDEISKEPFDNIYGLFKNQYSARERLRQLADEYRLCLSVMGFEPQTKGKGCFRSAINKCAGACCGQEDMAQHNLRLHTALYEYKITAWPYAGAIALKESFGRLKQFHVLFNWRYHGSYKSERGLKNYTLNPDTLFDADMYRILAKPILLGTAEVIELD
ncbi:hypothetical protein [Pseudochrobactrum sp. MP213Fo]|uniref:hypothetical protein n=1 Tax=Pseudochrobactrum sp. MP213Fo TaxID=3022250 RepID=UPI003B9F48B3